MQGQIGKKKQEEEKQLAEGRKKFSVPVEHPQLLTSMTEGIIKTTGEFEQKARASYEKSVAIAKKEILLTMSRKSPSQKKAPPKKRPPRPFMDPPKK